MTIPEIVSDWKYLSSLSTTNIITVLFHLSKVQQLLIDILVLWNLAIKPSCIEKGQFYRQRTVYKFCFSIIT